jgi:hypothetical protein
VQGREGRLLPYTQINDGKRDDRARLRPGDGDANVAGLLDALPANLPLSLEWPAPKDSNYTAEAWAKEALAGTRRFLEEYYLSRAASRA